MPEKKINLNTASRDEIARLPMVGNERADIIIENHPYKSWDVVGKIPGFAKGMVNDLRKGDVIL